MWLDGDIQWHRIILELIIPEIFYPNEHNALMS